MLKGAGLEKEPRARADHIGTGTTVRMINRYAAALALEKQNLIKNFSGFLPKHPAHSIQG